MDEVGGALVAIALVLCAVFIPTAFITGISGAFYRQFALTIATSTIISCYRVADTVAGTGRAAAEAARPRARSRHLEDVGPAVQRFFLRLQPCVREVVVSLCRIDAAGHARVGADAGPLCRAHRPDLFPVRPHAVRLHPATRPRLFHHRDHPAAGREPGADRSRGAQGVGNPAVAARRRERRGIRRLRRRDVHECAQFGRHFRHA